MYINMYIYIYIYIHVHIHICIYIHYGLYILTYDYIDIEHTVTLLNALNILALNTALTCLNYYCLFIMCVFVLL